MTAFTEPDRSRLGRPCAGPTAWWPRRTGWRRRARRQSLSAVATPSTRPPRRPSSCTWSNPTSMVPAGLVGIYATADDPTPRVMAGQGPAPAGATVDHYRGFGFREMPGSGVLATALPGAAPAWLRLLGRHAAPGSWRTCWPSRSDTRAMGTRCSRRAGHPRNRGARSSSGTGRPRRRTGCWTDGCRASATSCATRRTRAASSVSSRPALSCVLPGGTHLCCPRRLEHPLGRGRHPQFTAQPHYEPWHLARGARRARRRRSGRRRAGSPQDAVTLEFRGSRSRTPARGAGSGRAAAGAGNPRHDAGRTPGPLDRARHPHHHGGVEARSGCRSTPGTATPTRPRGPASPGYARERAALIGDTASVEFRPGRPGGRTPWTPPPSTGVAGGGSSRRYRGAHGGRAVHRRPAAAGRPRRRPLGEHRTYLTVGRLARKLIAADPRTRLLPGQPDGALAPARMAPVGRTLGPALRARTLSPVLRAARRGRRSRHSAPPAATSRTSGSCPTSPAGWSAVTTLRQVIERTDLTTASHTCVVRTADPGARRARGSSVGSAHKCRGRTRAARASQPRSGCCFFFLLMVGRGPVSAAAPPALRGTRPAAPPSRGIERPGRHPSAPRARGSVAS